MFKKKFEFEKRKQEAIRIKDRYPDRIPIIIEKSNSEKNIKNIDKSKYLVPKDLTVGQFNYVIRKRLSLQSEKAMFMFCNGSIPPTSELLSAIYADKQDKDGFLYMTYCSENTFG